MNFFPNVIATKLKFGIDIMKVTLSVKDTEHGPVFLFIALTACTIWIKKISIISNEMVRFLDLQ